MTDELLDERIRAALPRDDDSDWRDVRRRARKKAAPAALALTAVVSALIAAPAFAFRHEIADLWARAEPERNLYVRAFAECGEGSFTLEFHPEQGAVVRQGGRTLARASVSDRQIECDASIHSFKGTPDESRRYHGELVGRDSASVAITCRTDALLEVGVNPIWYRSDITGSAIVVADRQTKRYIAAASFKRDPFTGRIWARASWDATRCARS
jgi:hypothetical protein